MLVVTVDLLHETFRGTGADDLALAGDAEAEWPPSPARLFAAFVAADGTRERCRVTNGSELEVIASSVPSIGASGACLQNPILPRYAVVDERVENSQQNYPARQAQLVRPGSRCAPKANVVCYRWPELNVDDETLNALRLRAARIGYLGCADSPVRVRVTRDDVVDEVDWWNPSAEGDVEMPVAAPGYLDQLDSAFDRWSAGEPLRRAWIVTPQATYASPRPAVQNAPAAPRRALWLRFDRAIGGRKVLAVAETLRNATLEHLSEIVGGRDLVPSEVHGHHQPGGDHVHWLPLPFVGTTHADGRIRGACLLLPASTSNELEVLLRAALGRVTQLSRPGFFYVNARVFDGAPRPWSTNPARWITPASRWVSAFPVVHERRRKGGATLDDVASWCRNAGLPAPIAFRSIVEPLISGAMMLTPEQVSRNPTDRRPYTHVEVEFADPVPGPIALGRMRHFGLGLMAPIVEGAKR